MTDTTQTMRAHLRQHGLPEAWAEWAREIDCSVDRPTQGYVRFRPTPPERVVTWYEEDGFGDDHERTDAEMIEAWAEYADAIARWCERHGSATSGSERVSVGSEVWEVTLRGNGARLSLRGASKEGPWRAVEWAGRPEGRIVETIDGLVREWFGGDGWLKPREPDRKPPCYIAGPFRGASHWDIAQNVRRAEAVALAAWRSGLFSWVYCPHANTAHFQDAAPDEVWIEGHLEAMRAVHREGGVVLVTNGWEKSSGTRAELEEAHGIGMPAFRFQGDGTDMNAGVRMARRMCRDVHLTTWITSEISQPLASYLTERAGRWK